jgi:glycosyltransferase involved in cell wall biosynthesis
MQNKKILFLTTHNLATNPRLVKEIRLALETGFSVEVICFEFDNWSKALNEILKAELKEAKMIVIPAGRKPFWNWFSSVASEKFHRNSARLFASNNSLSKAVSRRSGLLVSALKKASRPDWVIGHNPGALYPTWYAAKKFNCKAGFDVEDYHPGEGQNRYLQKLTKKLMQAILPKMDYISFASPLIKAGVVKDIATDATNWFTLLNYFPSTEFDAPLSLKGPLKLVWFSQNIAAGRGLELILPAVKKLNEKVELHLFGNADKAFYEKELKGIDNVIIHEPLPQQELHKKLNEFDISLALEFAIDKNRELCLTNKILAGLQAGLYVLATNTPAQESFMKSHPLHGQVFKATQKAAEEALNELVQQKEIIRYGSPARCQDFRRINWENESSVLVNTWANELKK